MKGAGRRVAITGYGVVAPCGIGKKAFWDGLNGPGITGHAQHRDRGLGSASLLRQSEGRSTRRSRRTVRIGGCRRGVRACRHAHGRIGPIRHDLRNGCRWPANRRGTDRPSCSPRVNGVSRRSLVPMMMPNAPGAAISMRYGLRGPNETITTACAASTHAIGYAARLIAWGMCDAVVTGGAESAGCAIGVVSFGNMTALSTSGSSRPFDVDRDGFVLGEGRRRVDAGGVVGCREAWGDHHRRGARRRQQRRRPSHHRTSAGRSRRHRVHAAGPGRRRTASRRHRPHQCPRHVHPAQRRSRGGGHHRDLRANAVCRSPRRRASPVTPSAPPARWKPLRCCWRSSIA